MLCVCCVLRHSVMSNSMRPHALQPSRLLCLWGFPRQEYWSGLPCPLPGDLPNPGIQPRSSALQENSLPSESPRKPNYALEVMIFLTLRIEIMIFYHFKNYKVSLLTISGSIPFIQQRTMNNEIVLFKTRNFMGKQQHISSNLEHFYFSFWISTHNPRIQNPILN